ncbi:DUF1127 domain-containing protein [Bradyrhizobium sp. UFLA05-109]
MPPQQTNITSETGRDAAELSLAPSIAPTRSILGLLQRYWRAFQERRQRQSSRTTLQDLSDRELMDIGLTRAEVDYITGQRAIDTLRDSTRYLWGRGVM